MIDFFKIHKEKLLSFSEQASFSLANFVVFVYLARLDSKHVLFFSTIYSFALIYTSLLKGAAFNRYLVSGHSSVNSVLSFFWASAKNFYVLVLVLVMLYFMWLRSVPFDYLAVFFYYSAVEYFRVYLISIKKVGQLFFLSLIATWLPVVVLVYFSGNWFVVYMVSFFIFAYYIRGARQREVGDKCLVEMDFNSAATLTFSNSLLVHGPLWFLYLTNPIAAQYFVMVRNIFQPFQVMSRAFDLVEKSTVRHQKYKLIRLRLAGDVFLSLPFLLVSVVAGYYGYSFIYGDASSGGDLDYFILYSFVAYLTHIARFYENDFYRSSRIDLMIFSSWVSAIFCACVYLCLYIYEVTELIFVMINLIASWCALMLCYSLAAKKIYCDDSIKS